MTSLCTVFASAKTFTGNARIAQYNSLKNWQALGLPVILLGDDEGMAEAAHTIGATHIAEIEKTDRGTPLLSDMFGKAQAAASTPFVCYINADILLPPSFLTALEAASQKWKRFLMVGRRWDVEIPAELSFDAGWVERLEALRLKSGKQHSPWGLDYFVFPRGAINSMPPFAIGRPWWDGWLIWTLAAAGMPLLNASQGVPILHQNHGYGHVPGGRGNTYFGPEGDVNQQLLLEIAPEYSPVYASTFRPEWAFDGKNIALDESWARWWWYTRHRLKPRRVLKDCLRALLGEVFYARVRGSDRRR
jgi:hypothetical protein